MAGKLRAVVLFLALAGSPAFAQQAQVQQVDPNFQALLNALMQGTPVALLTRLPDGTVEVTSFAAPGQRTAADAAMLIERARINLANLGVAQPSGLQLATALAGGAVTVPTGSTQLSSVLPQGATGVGGDGTWKLSKDGFCTTWKGSNENCYTLMTAGEKKWSVMKGKANGGTWSK